MNLMHLMGLIVSIASSSHQQVIPVWSGSLPPTESIKGNRCNTGVVRGIRPARHLLVRAGPGKAHAPTDRLTTGERIYICNESGVWLGVVYRRSGFPCKGAQEGLDIRQSVKCRSGWVHRDWIEAISG